MEVGTFEFHQSTYFQKNNIGWPRQPPTEKVPKFNQMLYDPNNIFFLKHQNKLIFVIKLLN